MFFLFLWLASGKPNPRPRIAPRSVLGILFPNLVR